jgi:hypothetical protein
VIPEIDIWRAAALMMKRYGDDAQIESGKRADELANAGDEHGSRHGPGTQLSSHFEFSSIATNIAPA